MVYDHTQSLVYAIVVDDGLLYVGLGTYTVKVFDLETMQENHEIDVGWEVRDIAISDKHIFVGSLGETIKIFRKGTYDLVEELYHEIGVHKLFVHGNYLYSLGYNENVHVWDLKTYEHIRSLPGHSERVNTIAFDDGIIYTGDGFGEMARLRLWNENGELIEEVDLNAKRVTAIYVDEASLIVATTIPSQLLVLDKETLEETQHIHAIEGDVHTIRKIGSNYYISSHKQINEFDRSMTTGEFSVTRSLNEMVQEISCLIFDASKMIYAVRDRVQFVDRQSFQLLNFLEFKE